MKLRRAAAFLWLSSSVAGAMIACGSRTGLLVGSEPPLADVVVLPSDVTSDRGDATVAVPDALPFLDVQRDVPKPPPLGCLDAGETQIYLITVEDELLAFYPPTLNFTTVGTLNCPGANGQTPFSMGVERSGTAYSVFTDGRLFRVNTATAACQATPFLPGQLGYSTFGMGYAGDQVSESLYIADRGTGLGLGTINTTSFQVSRIGAFVPDLPERCELTGTGSGELFAYCINVVGAGGAVAQIDRANGRVVARTPVNVGSPNDAFAFAFWGGDFYMFNGSGGSTTVTRFDPALRTETVVATHPSTIVGAGVSTCAPN